MVPADSRIWMLDYRERHYRWAWLCRGDYGFVGGSIPLEGQL